MSQMRDALARLLLQTQNLSAQVERLIALEAESRTPKPVVRLKPRVHRDFGDDRDSCS